MHPRPPPLKENGDNEASAKQSSKVSEESPEANSTTRSMEDCLQVKTIKTENSVVRAVALSRTHTVPNFSSTVGAWSIACHLQLLFSCPHPRVQVQRWDCRSGHSPEHFVLSYPAAQISIHGVTGAMWYHAWPAYVVHLGKMWQHHRFAVPSSPI